MGDTNWATRVSASFSSATNGIAQNVVTNLCSGDTATIYVSMNTNSYPSPASTPGWYVTWSDGVLSPPAHFATSNVVSRVVRTNGIYTIKNFVIRQSGQPETIDSALNPTVFEGSAAVTVIPLPAPPANPNNGTNCACLPPALSVSVPAGYTANWYNTNGTLLASGPATFTPTNKAAGLYTYYASAVNTNGCESTNTTAVLLSLQSCSNLLSINLLDASHGQIVWSGNKVLQSTTNLVPLYPTNWINVATGSLGCNTSLWYNIDATNKFFRLYGP